MPVFLGYEEFFKEFILTASNYSFNKHLSDTFISEIIEINDSKFSINDYDDSGMILPSNIHFCDKFYISCIRKIIPF